MLVRMLMARRLLDAGTERPLDRGQAYDLPPVVAQSLIATGAAVEDEGVTQAPLEQVDERSMRAPETKPMQAPERKAQPRRAS